MVASEIRANARKSLTGKWGKAVLMILAYMLIVWVISFVCGLIPGIGPIVLFVISTPISYGLIASFMKLKRGEEVGYVEFLNNGFSAFGRVWGVVGNTILKMILPVCLLIISIVVMSFGLTGSIVAGFALESSSGVAGFGFLGIIGMFGYLASLVYAVVKGYLYSLTNYILFDNPDMTGKQIVEESERLMRGHRWNFFWLGLSFIGWVILSAFTLYIGLLWVLPYMMIAQVCFYEALAGKTKEPVVEAEVKSEE